MNKSGLYSTVLAGAAMAATTGCDNTEARREAVIAMDRKMVEAQLESGPMRIDGGAVFTVHSSEPDLYKYAQITLRTQADALSVLEGGHIRSETMVAVPGSMHMVIIVNLPDTPADALKPANEIEE